MPKTKHASRIPAQVRHKNGPIAAVPAIGPDSSALGIFFNKRGHYVVVVLMTILAVVIFRDFLTFQKFYLFRDIASDTITNNYPSTYHIADYLRTDGIPRWSFAQGLGQNIFPLSLSDPFTDLLYLLGKEHIAGGIVYAEILKIFCAGFLCFLFLRKIGSAAIAAVLGALSCAFSGFMMVAGAWQVFSTEAVFIVFMLYAFEKLFQDNDWRLFPLSIGLITAFQPFCMFTESIFLAIYVVFRIIETGAVRAKTLVPLGVKVMGLGIIGIVCSSFFSIGTLQQMLDSPRVSGDSSFFKTLLSRPIFGFQEEWLNVTAVMRLFSNDLAGTGSLFTGWGNYLEAPLFYCGLVNLLLVPQLFTAPGKRRKIGCAFLLGALIIPVIFPFFRNAFWAFSVDYYRIYGFLAAIVLIVCSAQYFSVLAGNGRPNLRLLAGTLAVLLAALYFPYPLYKHKTFFTVDEPLRTTVAAMLAGYAGLIALMRFTRIKGMAAVVLVAATCGELGYFAWLSVDTRPVITDELVKQKTWYNDGTVDAVTHLHAIDPAFYRVYKDYSSGMALQYSINDAKVQDFYGLSSYHSFNQKYFIRFVTEMGLIDARDEWQTRWVRAVLSNDRRLHSIVSLKYQLTNKSDLPWKNLQYDSIARVGNITILKNRLFLPLGFTYDSCIRYKKFHTLSNEQKIIMLQRAVVVDSGIPAAAFLPTAAVDTAPQYPLDRYAADVARRKQDTLVVSRFGQNALRGTIAVAKNKILFFSIPYDKGWRATVDGRTVSPIVANIGFLGIPLEKGSHTVELGFTPPLFFPSLFAGMAGIVLYILTLLIKSSRDRKRATPREARASFMAPPPV
jgi:uncharacterized membrane protein YfhO